MLKRTLWLVLPLVATACGESANEARVEGRWYTPSQVETGRRVFRKHCAECHGEQAQGTANWKQRLPDGSFPPPPLNGSAHAWHHSMSVLKRTIDNGGIPLGGTMPAFAGKLTEDEKLAAIAFFQSYWSDDIYDGWRERGGLD